MAKHYNGTTVWGTLDKFANKMTENNKSFIEIYVHCQHPEYGNVKVLGRIWSKDVIDDFMKHVKDGTIKRGTELRLEGNIQQYDGRNDVIRTSFNFYRFEFGPLKERKAAFRLVGKVVSFNEDEDKLKILIIQEQKENFEPRQDEVEVIVPKIIQLEMPGNLETDTLIRIKGYLQCEEDEFGEAKEYQRPVVKQLEIIEQIADSR